MIIKKIKVIAPLTLLYVAATSVQVWATDSLLAVNSAFRFTADADPSATSSPLWTFLNSSFVLWFLSSVVVAAITAAYARYQKRHTERTQKTETRNHLNTEISSRIANALVALRLDHKRITKGEKYWASAMYNEGVLYLDNRFTDRDGRVIDFSVYPEYQTRRFRSLMVELGAVAEASMLPTLRKAQASYTRLEELADETPLREDYSRDPDRETTLAAIRESCEILEALQTHAFWRAPL